MRLWHFMEAFWLPQKVNTYNRRLEQFYIPTSSLVNNMHTDDTTLLNTSDGSSDASLYAKVVVRKTTLELEAEI